MMSDDDIYTKALNKMASGKPISSSTINHLRPCHVCEKYAHQVGLTRLKACGKCHAAFYCSTECQKKHWKEHKTRCSARVEVIEQHGQIFYEAYARWREIGRFFMLGVVHHSLRRTFGVSRTFDSKEATKYVTIFCLTFDDYKVSFRVDEVSSLRIVDLPEHHRHFVAKVAQEQQQKQNCHEMVMCRCRGYTGLVPLLIDSSTTDFASYKISMDKINSIRLSMSPKSSHYIPSSCRKKVNVEVNYLRDEWVVWAEFINNALGLYTGIPMHKSHRICITVDQKKGSNRFQGLREWKVLSLDQVQERFSIDSNHLKTMVLCPEVKPDYLHTLVSYPKNVSIPIIFQLRNGFFVSSNFVQWIPNAVEHIIFRDAKLNADKAFEQLRKHLAKK